MKSVSIGFFIFSLLYCKNGQRLTSMTQDCDTSLKEEVRAGWKRLANTARNPDVSFFINDTLVRKIIDIYKLCIINKKSKTDIVNLFGNTTYDFGQELIYDCVDTTNGKVLCLRFRFDNNLLVQEILYHDCWLKID